MLKKTKIAVIGATGYTGLDLISFMQASKSRNSIFMCNKKFGQKLHFLIKELKKSCQKLLL